jgi:hypothetical protein
MLMCTILTFAMCANPSVAGAFAFGDLTVPIVWTRVQLHSCSEVGQTTAEAGLTHIETAWSAQQLATNDGTYTGRLVVHLERAHIDLSTYSWDKISPAGVNAMRHLIQATLWHELGHLRTAQKTIEALNAGGTFSAASADEFTALADDRGNAAAARIGADQDEYDLVADHGLRQATLPPPLGGPDTIVTCPER